ncbi:AMP-dependent synthetase/ligase [Haloechinothrix salitolerans]|uniref:Acyl-CoA synthetase n=1 Tax=Haloechinothrix salitolerans TaxID=926830 RepID=A0ABW2C313_9PSEU
MKQQSTASNLLIEDDVTTVDAPLRYRAERPELALIERRVNGAWVTVTAKAFADEVDATAKGLIASGVTAGDRVAILCSTRYEWTVLDYAIWRAGATTVAVYESTAPAQLEWILADSGTSLLILETSAHYARHEAVIKNVADLRETLVIDDKALAALTARGTSVGDQVLDQRHAHSRSSDIATLIYTSGTTGQPKGVALTHANFLAECDAARRAVGVGMEEGRSTLLFLPLAHVFARVVSVGCIENRVRLGHTNDLPNLIPDLMAFKPEYVLSVPRIFEKIYNATEQRAQDGGNGEVFAEAARTAVEYSKALQSGNLAPALAERRSSFDPLVYAPLRAALGGRCEGVISGGAPLGERLGHFFNGAGIPVYEGYGLTETTGAVTANSNVERRIGSVGRPLPGVTVGVAEDGEILLKGPTVFSHYWENPEATVEAIRDGWFHSGDIGRLEDGFLFITGRKKEIIITAGGKNVAPAQLEDTIRAHPLVSQCLVVGDQKPYIAALITLDPEAVPGWLERHQLPATTPIHVVAMHHELLADIDEVVQMANSTVSNAEAIKRFAVLDSDFSIESDELTPTLKVKRSVVGSTRSDAIAALYR